MKEYLEYLDKLNSLVDTNALERVRNDYQQQKSQVSKLGRLSFMAVLLTIGLCVPAYDGLGKLLRLALYGESYNGIESLLWLILFIVVFGFTLWIVAFYSVDKEKLNSMLGISYVEHSYATVRNTIIDEGDEFKDYWLLNNIDWYSMGKIMAIERDTVKVVKLDGELYIIDIYEVYDEIIKYFKDNK